MARMCCRLAASAAGLLLVPAGVNAEIVYGTTIQGFLVSWDSESPGTLRSGVAVSGLQSNEVLVGLDFRPRTGEMYGVGSQNQLYRIDPSTGRATSVGQPLTTALDGSNFGVDFNPVADRIRVLSNTEQNLRVNPDTGDAIVDGRLAYAAGDQNFGADPDLVHAAYTNNRDGAQSTQLFALDADLNALVLFDDPNSGVVRTVGALGEDITEFGGFDISGVTGVAYAALRNSTENASFFWRVDLQTGRATRVGEISAGIIVTSMTLIPAPGATALGGVALLLTMRRPRRR